MSWILYTIAATLFQTFRNLEQKGLNKNLDVLTTSWSRYILPLPLALFVAAKTFSLASELFIFYCVITAVFQIAGNIFLLKTFKSKNFSIGIAFYKTEVLQAMVIGFLFFNATISLSGFLAILVAMIGVGLMSGLVFDGGVKKFMQSLCSKAALYGLLTGFCFSISAFNLKFASEVLSPFGFPNLKVAVLVLLWVICCQNILICSVKIFQKRLLRDFKSLISLENKSAFLKTTISSFLGSICWFAAYGSGNVVYVKAVGQLELVLALMVSYFLLKEKLHAIEVVGIALTLTGILMLIWCG